MNDTDKKEMEKIFFKDYGYTPAQMEQVTNFIQEKFGSDDNGENNIAHELQSDLVHVDTAFTSDEDFQYAVTFGMGARKMQNFVNYGNSELSRLELYFILSKDNKLKKKEQLFVANELLNIAKFPFRENTFFAPRAHNKL